jgi:hypothetical protein
MAASEGRNTNGGESPMEILITYVVIALAGAFATNKVVEVYKHSETLDADRYASCVKHAEEVRECRGLE